MTIKCGILGFGYWGKILSKEILNLPDLFDLKLICDRHVEEGNTQTKDFNRFLESDIELVFIATQAKYHLENTLSCFSSGKDVFVEKPMAKTLEDAVFLAKKSEEMGRTLFVDHTFTSCPEIKTLKEILNNTKIDFFSSKRLNISNRTFDVGILQNIFYHDAYILDFLFGLKVSSLRLSKKENNGFVFEISVNLEMEKTKINIENSYCNKNKVRKIEVLGKGLNLLWDNESKAGLINKKTGEILSRSNYGGIRYKLLDVYRAYQSGIDDGSKEQSIRVLEFISKIEKDEF